MPWPSPPCTWPSTSIGFRIRPQSSTAMWRTRRTSPVCGVDLDHRDVGAERERRGRLAVHALGAKPGLHARREPRRSAAAAASSAQRDRARRARPRTSRPPSPSGEVGLVDLQQMRRERARLRHDLFAALERPTTRRPAASATPTCPRRAARRRCRECTTRTDVERHAQDRRTRSARTPSRAPGRAATCRSCTVTVPSVVHLDRAELLARERRDLHVRARRRCRAPGDRRAPGAPPARHGARRMPAIRSASSSARS